MSETPSKANRQPKTPSATDFVVYILRLARLRGWWDKLVLVGGAALIVLAFLPGREAFAVRCVAFIVLSVFLLTYAYCFNDICDADYARRSGQVPPTSLSRDQKLVAVSSIAAAVVLLAVFFPQPLACLMCVLFLVLATAYSARPVRLKERGMAGVLTGAFAQRPLILLIFVASVGAWDRLTLLLAAWLFWGGLLGMLGHQVKDRQRDLESAVRTFGAVHGKALSLALCWFALIALVLTALAPVAVFPAPKGSRVAACVCGLSLVYAGQLAWNRRRMRAGIYNK